VREPDLYRGCPAKRPARGRPFRHPDGQV